jgi:hypothetical protein
MYWMAILVCTNATLSVRHSNLIPLIPRRQPNPQNVYIVALAPTRLSYEEGARCSLKRGQGPNSVSCLFMPRDFGGDRDRSDGAPAYNFRRPCDIIGLCKGASWAEKSARQK